MCARQRWTGMPWYAAGGAASKPWLPSTQIILRGSGRERRGRRGSARRRSRLSPGGSRQSPSCRLLLAVGAQAENYRHRALEGAGAGLAAERHAHQGLVAVGQRATMESLECRVQGHPADGRNRAAERKVSPTSSEWRPAGRKARCSLLSVRTEARAVPDPAPGTLVPGDGCLTVRFHSIPRKALRELCAMTSREGHVYPCTGLTLAFEGPRPVN